MIKNINNPKSGFIAFLTVIVVAAAAIIMLISRAILNIGDGQMALLSNINSELQVAISGCGEMSLERLRESPDWVGGTFDIGTVSCVVEVVPTGSLRIITIDAILAQPTGSFSKTLRINAELSGGGIIVNNWEEISE